jgi:glycosyltransferase involved in cell wall biosynthesis|tara:strand:- start:515 stop:1261 length:747 start_codon:yes stop_codon:yes gene_type:complete
MKVSIITICFNSSKTIENTFKSIKRQSYKNIEYIVIDGKSNDGTLELIEEYKSIISVLISESDKGLYDAINKGISLSSGELIGVLHSDDVFCNDTVVEDIVEFHEKNKIDASVGNIIQVNKFGKKVRRYSAKQWSPEKLKIGFMPAHPSIFFKKELFEKFGGYHLDFVSGADYELIVRFFLRNKITWKYSDITTTTMLIGGISSSGYKSYKLISREIKKALELNNIKFSYFKILLRVIWKMKGFLKNK